MIRISSQFTRLAARGGLEFTNRIGVFIWLSLVIYLKTSLADINLTHSPAYMSPGRFLKLNQNGGTVEYKELIVVKGYLCARQNFCYGIKKYGREGKLLILCRCVQETPSAKRTARHYHQDIFSNFYQYVSINAFTTFCFVQYTYKAKWFLITSLSYRNIKKE